VQQLFDDTWDGFTDNASDYFIGAMVFKDESDQATLVVDGQQRFSTLSIILAVIRDHSETTEHAFQWIQNHLSTTDAHGEHTPSLILSEADRDRFKSTVTLSRKSDGWIDPHSMPKSASAKNFTRSSQWRLIDAYRTISDRLTEKLGSQKDVSSTLTAYAEFLSQKLKLISISVPTDEMAYTVFETLNERGLGLSVSDLLKNHLFSNAGSNQANVEASWNQVEDAIDPDKIPQMLRHQYMADVGKVSTRNLFSRIKTRVDSPKISPAAFVDKLKKDAEIYKGFLDPKDSIWESEELLEQLSRLNDLNAKQCYPLLLAVARQGNESRLASVVKDIVSFTIRYSTIGDRNPNDLEDLYTSLSKKVREESYMPDDIRSGLREKAPSDDVFISEFSVRSVSPRASATRLLLRELESEAWKNGVPPETHKPSQCHIEHIMPQKPNSAWREMLSNKGEKHKHWVNRIGNLTFLEKKLNIKNSNEDFIKVKQSNLAASIYRLATEVAAYDVWTTDEISKRQTSLAQKAVKIWSL
jgi:uncharacterized protein with ParB-like and HNH nuclease domain